MNEAWFSAQTAPYFSLLSLTSLLALLQIFVARGVHRRLVTAGYGAGVVLGLGLLALGGIAWMSAQPGFVTFALGFPGLIIFPTCVWALTRVGTSYRQSEMRRSIADDL